MKEELNISILEYRLLHTIDNIFEIDGINAHEITQIYEVDTIDSEQLVDGTIMHGDVMESKIRWIEVSDLTNGTKILYPKELGRLLG